MRTTIEPQAPVFSTSLQDYFHCSVRRAVEHQGVPAGEATVYYLAGLLTNFSRSENLFEYGRDGVRLRSLAHLYADAVHSESERGRRLLMRQMGDVALFVSGMFSGFFNRRRALVGMDYYIAMGGQAYASLAGSGDGAFATRETEDVFERLSTGFGDFVGVLTEVGNEGARERHQQASELINHWGWHDRGIESVSLDTIAARVGRFGRH